MRIEGVPFEVRPDEVGISAAPFQPPREPELELHPWKGIRYVERCECCEQQLRSSPLLLVCKTCNAPKPEHDRVVRRALKEIERRTGRVEHCCPVCGGTGRLTDEHGVSGFYPCVRCKGWGRVWRAPRRKADR